MSGKRARAPKQRRAALLDAARRLFLERGVGATSMEAIALAAGVAKGTVYLYFSSKDALREALGETYAKEHLAHIRAGVEAARGLGWRALLERWASANVGFYLDTMALHDALFHESRAPDRAGLTDNPAIADLAALLEAGAREGAYEVEDARATALFLFSGLHALADDFILAGGDRDALLRRASALCVKAVRACRSEDGGARSVSP